MRGVDRNDPDNDWLPKILGVSIALFGLAVAFFTIGHAIFH